MRGHDQPLLPRAGWSYADMITGRRYKTRFLAAEEAIRVEHPDAVPVPGSRQVREVPEPEELTAGHLQRGWSE